MIGMLKLMRFNGTRRPRGLFHAVEKLFTSFPLYRRRVSTVWKTSGQRTTRQGILLMGAALALGLAVPARAANHIRENIQSWTARASSTSTGGWRFPRTGRPAYSESTSRGRTIR